MSNNGNNDNPYAVPRAKVVEAATLSVVPGEGRLLDKPSSRRASEGGEWVSEGWQLFRKHSMSLVVLGLVYFVLSFLVAIILQMLPFVGGVASAIVNTLLIAGLVISVDRVYRGEDASIGNLFDGFAHPARLKLISLSVIMSVVYMLIAAVAAAFAGVIDLWLAIMGVVEIDPATLAGMMEKESVSILLMVGYILLLALPVTMAFWFSSPLVLLNGMGAVPALGYSFGACARNILPMTVYSLVFIFLFLASIFTLFLAWIVLFPVLIASWFVSYRRICIGDDREGVG